MPDNECETTLVGLQLHATVFGRPVKPVKHSMSDSSLQLKLLLAGNSARSCEKTESSFFWTHISLVEESGRWKSNTRRLVTDSKSLCVTSTRSPPAGLVHVSNDKHPSEGSIKTKSSDWTPLIAMLKLLVAYSISPTA